MARATTTETDVAMTTVAGPALVESLRRVSWGAVFGGVVISLISQFLLSMLGLGIGVSTIDPMASGETPGAGAFSIAAAIWWTISGIIAAFAGGWVAGRLSGAWQNGVAALHGLVTWATTMLLVFYLMTTAAGALIGGAFGILGNTLSGMGETARAMAPQLADASGGPLGDLRQQIEQTMEGGQAGAKAQAMGSVMRVVTTRDASPADRDQAATVLAQQAGISQDEARDRLTQWSESYQRTAAEMEQQGRQAAEKAAAIVSRAAIYGFVALVLGAIAGTLGGRAGAPRDRLTVVD
jgi:hypothetical protein